MYFPDRYPKGRTADREYTFNVLNTLRPDYVSLIIKNAYDQRNSSANQDQQLNMIHITDEWKQQLDSVPFISSKMISCLNSFRVQGKDGVSVKG